MGVPYGFLFLILTRQKFTVYFQKFLTKNGSVRKQMPGYAAPRAPADKQSPSP
jgi:hypothetical protein